MSSAFVPGRIRLDAPLSKELNSFCCSSVAGSGESWSSAIGGGLGSRGELEGDGTDAIATVADCVCEAVSSARVGRGFCCCPLTADTQPRLEARTRLEFTRAQIKLA